MNWLVPVGALAAAFYYGVQKLQKMMIYPSSFPEDSRTEVDNPSSFNLPYEELWLETSDNLKLHAYLIPVKNAKKTVVMLGPNAGNIGHSLPLAELFHEFGVNVLTVSYRGYGRSEGEPSEKGLKIDADTVAEYISSNPTLASTSIVLYGRSLGGAVAIYFAATAKSLVSGLIVENTFLSIEKLVPSVLPIAKPFTWMINQRWDSETTIGNINEGVAVLFLAGEKDELIPPGHFQSLYQLCPATNKSFKGYPSGTHNDTCVQPGYWRDVQFFLDTCIPPLD